MENKRRIAKEVSPFHPVSQDACGISSASPQSDDKTDGKTDDQSDDEDKENEAGDEEEEEDGGGWITPSNIGQLKMDCADWTAPADVTVGCLTTDFAMQVNGRLRHRRRPSPRLAEADRRLIISSFLPERPDSDWTSRAVCQRDGDQAGEELHPALSRLLQVRLGGCCLFALCCIYSTAVQHFQG